MIWLHMIDYQIIDRAREYVSLDDIRFKEAIKTADTLRATAEKSKEQAEAAQRESMTISPEAIFCAAKSGSGKKVSLAVAAKPAFLMAATSSSGTIRTNTTATPTLRGSMPTRPEN